MGMTCPCRVHTPLLPRALSWVLGSGSRHYSLDTTLVPHRLQPSSRSRPPPRRLRRKLPAWSSSWSSHS